MVSGMVRQMLHQVCQTDLCFANRKHPSQGFVCDPIHKLDLFSFDFTHLNCTAATSGNAFGGNRAPSRVHKSVTKAELREGSFQIVSQPHSPPIMCTSVSRTERKLPPRSRVNSSTLRVETACKTLLFAQRSYS